MRAGCAHDTSAAVWWYHVDMGPDLERFQHFVYSVPQWKKAVLLVKGLQISPSNVYLTIWPVSLYSKKDYMSIRVSEYKGASTKGTL